MVVRSSMTRYTHYTTENVCVYMSVCAVHVCVYMSVCVFMSVCTCVFI